MMPNCTAWELLASTIFQNTIIASFAVATGNVGFRAPVFVAFGAFSALPGWGNGPRQTAGAWALERHAQSLHLFEIFLFTPFHTFSYFFHLFGIFSHLISSSPHEVWRLGAEAGSGRGCVEGRKAALGGAAAERPPRCLSTFEYLWMWFANLCLKYIFFFQSAQIQQNCDQIQSAVFMVEFSVSVARNWKLNSHSLRGGRLKPKLVFWRLHGRLLHGFRGSGFCPLPTGKLSHTRSYIIY